MKTGGPVRGVIGRWIMRLEAAQGIFRIVFLAITAASTLTSALVALGHQWLAPYVLGGGVILSPAFAWVYVEAGVFNRKNRERVDRGDNFAGPGFAMNGFLRAEQLSAALAAMKNGHEPEEIQTVVNEVTEETLREYRDGIDLQTVYQEENQ